MDYSRVAIIGVPMDLGAGRRGVDMGPSAMRVAGVGARVAALGYGVSDLGNIEVDQAESVPDGEESARYLRQIATTCERLAAQVADQLAGGAMPLVLGGDHSIAAGTVSGVARARGEIGLIWIDAHADMNTAATSPSGNVHGMPLACLIGAGPAELTALAGFTPAVKPGKVVLVGIRDVDGLERDHVRESGVNVFTMRDIDERGMPAAMRDAIALASDGTTGFHVSFDMDSLDPDEAPGVGTPVRGGLSYREAHLAMEMICDSRRMLSLEVVEVNPTLDERNRTAELAVELIASALGKRIL